VAIRIVVRGEDACPVEFAWLEITPSCTLHCTHCYAGSMPGLGDGRLTCEDWKQIITALRSRGTTFVQFIGGEPTIHPHFCELVTFAAAEGLKIEVYTNLLGISSRMWDIFIRHNVRIATSFYSTLPAVHDAITRVAGSQVKTLANIKKAVEMGLIVRVGVICVNDQQNIADVKSLLVSLGVEEARIGVDRTRGVGRGENLIQEEPIAALCGKCVQKRCAVTANGDVFPCIFARSFLLGNVLQQDIGDIVTGVQMQTVVAELETAFQQRQIVQESESACEPLDCNPECDPLAYPPCGPDCCPETVASCEPTEEPSDDDDE